MVVVPKKNGKNESVLKMKPLNECVLKEIHPKVDETLAQLSGANIFSKLDTNSGFLQIPLAKKLQNLTNESLYQGKRGANTTKGPGIV